jgi:hypothetical protein
MKRLDAAEGKGVKSHVEYRAAVSGVTAEIKAQTSAIDDLRKQVLGAQSTDQIAAIEKEIAGREQLVGGLQKIADAESRLSAERNRATKEYYSLLAKDPRKDLISAQEKESALRDYIIEQTKDEVAVVAEAKSGYEDLRKSIGFSEQVDKNTESIRAQEKAQKESADRASQMNLEQAKLYEDQATLLEQLTADRVAAEGKLKQALATGNFTVQGLGTSSSTSLSNATKVGVSQVLARMPGGKVTPELEDLCDS